MVPGWTIVLDRDRHAIREKKENECVGGAIDRTIFDRVVGKSILCQPIRNISRL